ncbi:MAG: helix-turn-helix domain-containing protein [Paludibacteraceae bacterium]|nr:helix-turn-helix domain-containing protein [Paludibacteraceae bacterium]
MEEKKIPLIDCPVDYLLGDASGKIMNEYGRFPCNIKCGVYAFMVRGSAKATINITEYTFRQHDVLLLEPSSFLLIHECSDDALVYYILFSSAFLERNTFMTRMSLDALHVSNPIVHLTDEYADLAVSVFDVLQKALNCRPSMLTSEKMVQVFNIMQLTFADIANQHPHEVKQPLDRATIIYQQFTKLVCSHYKEWHHVAPYAKTMNLTAPYLCSTIRKACGKTAAQIIDEAIITDAKAQLKLSDTQVKAVAMSLGFDNEAFFYRYFKAHVGVTPTVYRNN